MKQRKLLFIGLIITLASVFFWTITNRFLFPSRAGSEQVGISFEQNQYNVPLQNGQTQGVPINILLTTNPQTQITGATIVLRYDPKELDYSAGEETFADPNCVKNGFRFVRRVREVNDSGQGLLILTRIVDPLVTDAELPTGRMCWGTVVFKPKTGAESRVSFETTDISGWEIVGPNLTALPRFDDPKSTQIATVENSVPTGGVQ